DTASVTLLMVGLGQAHRGSSILRRQAQRDLSVLRTFGDRLPDRLDLVLLIRAAIDLVPRPIDLVCPIEVTLPSKVATRIADATAQAVHNAVRHAAAELITVDVVNGDELLVVVTDSGIGFDLARVAETRHGIRDSIRGRLADIGGTATITSVPGHGTTVRL